MLEELLFLKHLLFTEFTRNTSIFTFTGDPSTCAVVTRKTRELFSQADRTADGSAICQPDCLSFRQAGSQQAFITHVALMIWQWRLSDSVLQEKRGPLLLAFPSWLDWEPITRKCCSEVSYFRSFFMTVHIFRCATRSVSSPGRQLSFAPPPIALSTNSST